MVNSKDFAWFALGMEPSLMFEMGMLCACPQRKTPPVTTFDSMASGFSYDCEISVPKDSKTNSIHTNSVIMAITEDQVREELKRVIDPELFVNIVDLGLVYVVDIQPREDGKENVNVEMTLTSPMCPAGPQLVANSRQVIEEIDGVGDIDIKVVMDPPWGPDKMTEDARDQLGIF
jgi:metal-sulfur cluster biosynthetic enzyme